MLETASSTTYKPGSQVRNLHRPPVKSGTYETRHLRVIVWCQFRYRLRIQPSLRVSLRKTPQADRMLRSFPFGGTRGRKVLKFPAYGKNYAECGNRRENLYT